MPNVNNKASVTVNFSKIYFLSFFPFVIKLLVVEVCDAFINVADLKLFM